MFKHGYGCTRAKNKCVGPILSTTVVCDVRTLAFCPFSWQGGTTVRHRPAFARWRELRIELDLVGGDRLGFLGARMHHDETEFLRQVNPGKGGEKETEEGRGLVESRGGAL